MTNDQLNHEIAMEVVKAEIMKYMAHNTTATTTDIAAHAKETYNNIMNSFKANL